MSLATRLVALAEAVGTDIRALFARSSPYGFTYTVDPGLIRGQSDSIALAANGAMFARVPYACTITKIGLFVITASGNISVAAYANSGTGRNSTPGTRTGTSGAVACPAAGYREISLGASVTVAAGDWLCLSADNATAKFSSLLSALDSNSGLGAGRQGVSAASHPAPATPTITPSTGYTIVLIGIP